MAGTSTAGADWKGDGEIKALRRIVGGSAEEDEDVPASVGHNRPPHGTAHESTGPEIALEEQAQVVERALTEASGMMERVGHELVRLRARFCAVELGLHARILRLRAEGLTGRKIAEEVGFSMNAVWRHLRAAAEGREIQLDIRARTRFLDWAAIRFRSPRRRLIAYMRYGEHTVDRKAERAKRKKNDIDNRNLAKLAQLTTMGSKVAPPVFKKAFLALGDRGSASRTAVVCWAISLEAGSEDPQEVARWFAAHRLK